MTTVQLKRAVWLLTLLLVTAACWLSLTLLDTLFVRSQQAEVQNSALNILQERHAQPGQLVWLPDDGVANRAAGTGAITGATGTGALPRPMEPFTRDSVTSGYRLGSEELSYALYSGDASGLPSYFQEGALQDALLTTRGAFHSEYSDWDHRLTLHFYAPDGGTVAFTDRYWYAQGEADGGRLVATRVARRTVDVVMALDDGNWRVHHWRVLADDAPPDAPNRTSWPGLTGTLAAVRGVNYQARGAPFAALWSGDHAAEVDGDFARVRALGLNTVRIFVPYPLPPRALETLNTLLDSAGRHHLRVIPTLLDGYTGYRLADLPGAVQMLVTLGPALSRPEVLAVDLKNEADLDAPRAESPGADWTRLRFFLGVLAGQARASTPRPLTVGLTQPDLLLTSAFDLVTVHSYAAPERLEAALRSARGLGVPVLLEEFGYHTQANRLPDPHTEHEQAWQMGRVRDAAQRQGVGWLVWTLYDLPDGKVPGGRQVERHLGVLRADGSPKPAVLALQGQPVPPVSVAERLSKWRFLLPVMVVMVGGLGAWWWRRRRPPVPKTGAPT
ncbi:hypothetical protein [Deinococcus sp.]|uniref:hypothetical protein n=1 Tax=Deinococcus sp. TaxID=47478 RepID=UPI003C7D8229